MKLEFKEGNDVFYLDRSEKFRGLIRYDRQKWGNDNIIAKVVWIICEEWIVTLVWQSPPSGVSKHCL